MEQSRDVIQIKMCPCGRAPCRKSGRNCHFCNREAQKKYRAALKEQSAVAEKIKSGEIEAEYGYVYFFRAGERGMIKIGFSKNPRARLRQLQTGSSFAIKFLGAIPARQAFEHLLHMRFAEYRREGEWFEPAQELLDLLHDLMANAKTNAICDKTIFGTLAS